MQQTLMNLAQAFVGESQARNRYTIYSKIAKKEGYEQMAAIFLETADQEREHASQLFKMIQELKKGSKEDLSEIKIEAGVPTAYGMTQDNLRAAIKGENYEYTKMYPEFAEIAMKEGFAQIAGKLRAISRAEEHHEERYKKLLKELEAGTVFKKATETMWICRECGYVHVGFEPPKECPSCGHAQGFYQVQCENY